VVLIGMPGAGKTLTGEMVADRLGWKHVDTDDEVTARAGRSVPELFRTAGEATFRAIESDVVRSVLSEQSEVVVSLGGGAVADPVNREAIGRSGMVVWLRAEPSTLVGRVGDAGDRPLLAGALGVEESMTRLDAERRAHYAEVADVVVDVDGKTPDEVADEVVAQVEAGHR
jgi:shikimate kinase